MKSKTELLEELDSIEDRLFWIDMVDHWSESEEQTWDELTQRKKEILKELEIKENE
jgi:hypothetical protein